MRVLIIEDNGDDVAYIREMLHEASPGGFNVVIAESLAEGLSALANGGYQVILLDLSLPDSRGLDTFAEVYAAASDIPIVVLSGMADESAAIEAVHRGAQDYLVKGTISETVLARALQYAVERKAITKALADSEARFRGLAESIADVFYAMDKDLRITYWNHAAEAFTGVPATEAMGSSFYYVFPHVSGSIAEQAYLDVLRTARPQAFETQQDLGGQKVFYEVSVYPFKDGLSVFAKDVTARRAAEESLRHRAEIEALVAEISTSFVSLAAGDMDAGINRALRKMGEFAGVDRSYIFLLAADGTRMSNTHEWCATGIEPQRLILQDQSVADYLWSISRLRAGEIVHVPRVGDLPEEASPERRILELQDIQSLVLVPMLSKASLIGFLGFDSVRREKTWDDMDVQLLKVVSEILVTAIERHRAEEDTRQSEERFQVLLESLHDVVWAASYDGSALLYLSPTAETVYGRPRAAFFANSQLWREVVHPKDGPRVDQESAKLFAAGQADIEYRILRPDGEVRWLRDRKSVVLDKAGKPVRIGGVASDITEHKRIEEQWFQAQKMEAIGLLAGGIAHDFRNQLTVIKGFGERLLRRELVKEEAREDVEEILKAVEHSASLSAQLMIFSRKETLHPRVVNLAGVVSEMSKGLHRMLGEDIRLATRFQKDLGSVALDPSLFQQAVMNLAINARDAMPQGGELSIELSNVDLGSDFIKGQPDVAPGPYVQATITDTGMGMGGIALSRVFEPFFTTKPQGQGTGLGLSMVYGFVKQSQGCVEVASQVNRGTTFRMYFPRTAELADSNGPCTSPGPLPAGRGTVLVVEDEPGVRLLLAGTLRECGYTVLETSVPEEAASLARQSQQPLDLLITDVVMPAMSGPDVVAKVREVQSNVRVLYVSGYAGKALTDHGIREDNVAILAKPFSAEQLASAVRNALEIPV